MWRSSGPRAPHRASFARWPTIRRLIPGIGMPARPRQIGDDRAGAIASPTLAPRRTVRLSLRPRRVERLVPAQMGRRPRRAAARCERRDRAPLSPRRASLARAARRAQALLVGDAPVRPAARAALRRELDAAVAPIAGWPRLALRQLPAPVEPTRAAARHRDDPPGAIAAPARPALQGRPSCRASWPRCGRRARRSADREMARGSRAVVGTAAAVAARPAISAMHNANTAAMPGAAQRKIDQAVEQDRRAGDGRGAGERIDRGRAPDRDRALPPTTTGTGRSAGCPAGRSPAPVRYNRCGRG